ncbi:MULTISPECIES: cysteine desulfurase family protein [Niallia]|jgi:cysteine desulfurase|uniref:cysteine desulfurase family protein n=1 Tax=Niallia TaxID=2837506 RepID=UPI001F22F985|nr:MULTISPECIES: cysteine desulfurase family protein [Niallia]MCF2648710.1 cysteine desulfurase [Niallia circulans]MCM3363469.1 cysteine desulfurase [Niallia sp. MER TA 168]
MIYLDNSATTKPFPEVIESFTTVSQKYFGNPSSIHRIGMESEKLLIQAREQIAGLLEVKSNEVFFTSGGTEGNNTVLKGIARSYKSRGNHIITTAIEHDSIHKVMEQLEDDGFTISYVPVDEFGQVSIEDIIKNIRKETILVSIMHVNNEIGSIQPVEEIGKRLTNYPNIFFHVDGVQGIGKKAISINKANIDAYTISAHKFHGLKGNGVLYIKEGKRIEPLLAGGGQENTFRSGTENVAGAVATAKALRMQLQNQKEKLPILKQLNVYLREELSKIEGISIHTPAAEKSVPHIVNFSIEGIKAEVFVHALEERDIYISTTSACSSKTNKISKTLLGIGVPEQLAESSFRISLSYENTIEEMESVIAAIKDIQEWLRGVMK